MPGIFWNIEERERERSDRQWYLLNREDEARAEEKRKPIRSSLSAGRNGFRSSRLPGNRNLWAFPFG